MKETIKMYAIIPPDETYLDDFKLINSLASTKYGAWARFCYPALRKKGYEDDGFKAKKVIVKIEEVS